MQNVLQQVVMQGHSWRPDLSVCLGWCVACTSSPVLEVPVCTGDAIMIRITLLVDGMHEQISGVGKLIHHNPCFKYHSFYLDLIAACRHRG